MEFKVLFDISDTAIAKCNNCLQLVTRTLLEGNMNPGVTKRRAKEDPETGQRKETSRFNITKVILLATLRERL